MTRITETYYFLLILVSSFKIVDNMSAMKFSVHRANIDRSQIKWPGIIVLFFLFIWCLSAGAALAYEVKARAAVVINAASGEVLYAKNPEHSLMPASTTKLMTALVVLENAKLSDVVTISRTVAKTPPIKIGLKAGDRVTIETLLYAALVRSANDAAVALAEAIAGSEKEFVKLMNEKAIAVGALNTRFINATGLPGKGQYITAYDLSKIMREAIQYPVLKEIINTRVTGLSTESGKSIGKASLIKNTNKLLWSDDEMIGGKTGYTRQARHCFVCAGERDKEIFIVVLLGTPSRDLLWQESENLIAFGSKVMSNEEKPLIYITKIDYSPEKVKHKSRNKRIRRARRNI